MKIEIANQKHFTEVIAIYNWAIKNSTATLDTEVKTLESYTPFLNSLNNYPFFVAIKENKVIGWACLKPYSTRAAYERTVELSIYLSPEAQGKGIGSSLMEKLISAGKEKFHVVLSRVTAESQASIKLHEKYNFQEVGVMKEVGFKFNRVVDVILYQKILK